MNAKITKRAEETLEMVTRIHRLLENIGWKVSVTSGEYGYYIITKSLSNANKGTVAGVISQIVTELEVIRVRPLVHTVANIDNVPVLYLTIKVLGKKEEE